MSTTPPGPLAGPITRDQAAAIAAQALAALEDGATLAILPEATFETAIGWAFFYGPAGSEDDDLMPGNGPLVVERQDGRFAFLSTSVPPRDAVAAYEEERAAAGSLEDGSER